MWIMRTLSFIFTIVFALSVSAQSVEKSFENATRAARSGNYEKALADYRQAASLSENEKIGNDFLAKIYLNIGVCLYQLNRLPEAVGEFNKAIELSQGNYQKAFYALGMAETKLGNWRKATVALREAVRLKTDDGEAWFDLGLVLIEEKNFAEAEKAFQNSIRYESVAAADAHNNLGVILALRGDFARAEKEFKVALRESSGKSAEAQNNLKFCASYKQNPALELSARLKFSRKNNEGG
jgi:Flp pilus assembly protein TadD